MKTILFSVLLALSTTVQAQDTNADIYGNGVVNLFFTGQKAKQLFEAMPKKSQLTEKENCFPGLVIKLQGGLTCRLTENSSESEGSYRCELQISALTGKAIEWKNRTDICPDPDEI